MFAAKDKKEHDEMKSKRFSLLEPFNVSVSHFVQTYSELYVSDPQEYHKQWSIFLEAPTSSTLNDCDFSNVYNFRFVEKDDNICYKAHCFTKHSTFEISFNHNTTSKTVSEPLVHDRPQRSSNSQFMNNPFHILFLEPEFKQSEFVVEETECLEPFDISCVNFLETHWDLFFSDAKEYERRWNFFLATSFLPSNPESPHKPQDFLFDNCDVQVDKCNPVMCVDLRSSNELKDPFSEPFLCGNLNCVDMPQCAITDLQVQDKEDFTLQKERKSKMPKKKKKLKKKTIEKNNTMTRNNQEQHAVRNNNIKQRQKTSQRVFIKNEDLNKPQFSNLNRVQTYLNLNIQKSKQRNKKEVEENISQKSILFYRLFFLIAITAHVVEMNDHLISRFMKEAFEILHAVERDQTSAFTKADKSFFKESEVDSETSEKHNCVCPRRKRRKKLKKKKTKAKKGQKRKSNGEQNKKKKKKCNPNEVWKCYFPQCSKTFNTWKKLQSHMSRSHNLSGNISKPLQQFCKEINVHNNQYTYTEKQKRSQFQKKYNEYKAAKKTHLFANTLKKKSKSSPKKRAEDSEKNSAAQKNNHRENKKVKNATKGNGHSLDPSILDGIERMEGVSTSAVIDKCKKCWANHSAKSARHQNLRNSIFLELQNQYSLLLFENRGNGVCGPDVVVTFLSIFEIRNPETSNFFLPKDVKLTDENSMWLREEIVNFFDDLNTNFPEEIMSLIRLLSPDMLKYEDDQNESLEDGLGSEMQPEGENVEEGEDDENESLEDGVGSEMQPEDEKVEEAIGDALIKMNSKPKIDYALTVEACKERWGSNTEWVGEMWWYLVCLKFRIQVIIRRPEYQMNVITEEYIKDMGFDPRQKNIVDSVEDVHEGLTNKLCPDFEKDPEFVELNVLFFSPSPDTIAPYHYAFCLPKDYAEEYDSAKNCLLKIGDIHESEEIVEKKETTWKCPVCKLDNPEFVDNCQGFSKKKLCLFPKDISCLEKSDFASDYDRLKTKIANQKIKNKNTGEKENKDNRKKQNDLEGEGNAQKMKIPKNVPQSDPHNLKEIRLEKISDLSKAIRDIEILKNSSMENNLGGKTLENHLNNCIHQLKNAKKLLLQRSLAEFMQQPSNQKNNEFRRITDNANICHYLRHNVIKKNIASKIKALSSHAWEYRLTDNFIRCGECHSTLGKTIKSDDTKRRKGTSAASIHGRCISKFSLNSIKYHNENCPCKDKDESDSPLQPKKLRDLKNDFDKKKSRVLQKNVDGTKCVFRAVLLQMMNLIPHHCHQSILECMYRCAEDSIGHIGTSEKHARRLAHIIGFYLRAVIFHHLDTKAHFVQLGLDAQTHTDQFKVMSCWIRCVVDGSPCVFALGERRITKSCTGINAWELVKTIVTGSDILDDEYMGTLGGTEYVWDYEKDGEIFQRKIKMSHIGRKMNDVLMIGLSWISFLKKLVQVVVDGASDMIGYREGLRGHAMKDCAQNGGCVIVLHCINHTLELEMDDFKQNDIVKEVVLLLKKAKAWSNAHSKRRFRLEEIAKEHDYQYYNLTTIIDNRWFASLITSLENFCHTFPILFHYFSDEIARQQEASFRLTEEEIEYDISYDKFASLMKNSFLMYKIFLVTDMVKMICEGFALPMMSQNVTNVQMHQKYQALKATIASRMSVAQFNGPWEKMFWQYVDIKNIQVQSLRKENPIWRYSWKFRDLNNIPIIRAEFQEIESLSVVKKQMFAILNDCVDAAFARNGLDGAYAYIEAESIIFDLNALKPIMCGNKDFSNEQLTYLRDKLKNPLQKFWEKRNINLKCILPSLSWAEFYTVFCDFIVHILREHSPSINVNNFLLMWKIVLLDENLKTQFESALLSVEIMLVECPANCTAESLGRISNLIRNPTRRRMSESLLDVNICVYKNSPGMQFWEENHLDNLVFLHVYVVGGYHNFPISNRSITNAKEKFDKLRKPQNKRKRKSKKSNQLPGSNQSDSRSMEKWKQIRIKAKIFENDFDFQKLD